MTREQPTSTTARGRRACAAPEHLAPRVEAPGLQNLGIEAEAGLEVVRVLVSRLVTPPSAGSSPGSGCAGSSPGKRSWVQAEAASESSEAGNRS